MIRHPLFSHTPVRIEALLGRMYNDTLLSGSLALGCGIVAQHQLIGGNTALSLLLYTAAALLMLTALRRQKLSPSVHPAPSFSLNRGIWTGLGIALTALIFGAFGAPHFAHDPPGLVAWGLHLASIVLFLSGVYVLNSFLLQKPGRVEAEQPWKPVQIGLLVAITAIGTWLRIVRLDSLPFGTWYDEAEVGLQAAKVLDDAGSWPFFNGAIHGPMHYIYLVALSFKLFGISTESIRLVSALMGVVTILAAYLTGRELFDRRTGLVLAFLIAVSSWAVNFSRIGMHSTATTPLFVLLSSGFLLRALRRQQLTDYAWAGLFLGLGLNFYTSFRLFIPVVGLFLLHCTVAHRFFLRRSWLGLLVLGLGMLIVVAPLVVFAYNQPEIFWTRVHDTYLLADKAPDERISALVESTRKHLLMFHYRGDPNGRHNLPGEPMLMPVVGALAMLGLVLSLRWIWQPAGLLLPMWMSITLLGGILSLDFEAPQSLRANGVLPVVYLLAVVPVYGLWKEWDQTRIGRQYPRLFVWPLLALFVYVGYLDYDAYFVRRAQDFASWNAFSAAETITARLLQEEGDDADFYVISFLHHHPTVNFLAPDRQVQRLETSERLPLNVPAERDIVLIFNDESRSLYEEAQRLYPNATFREVKPDFGGPTVINYVRLTPEDIASLQGLQGTYYANAEWRGEPQLMRKDNRIAFDWDQELSLSGPFSVEWKGVIDFASYGPHRLILRTPAHAELYLDEELVMEGEGKLSAALMPAEGHHALRLRVMGGAGLFELAWQTPGDEETIIPAQVLHVPPVTNNGLLGKYYANGNWAGPEALAKLDSNLNLYFHVPVLPRPYTVEWVGQIHIPQGDVYRFGLESIDESLLSIDGQIVTDSPGANQYREGSVELAEGLHDILVRFSDRTSHTHINLYWQPPGQEQQQVPSAVLYPPQGNYQQIDLADAEELFQAPLPSNSAVTVIHNRSTFPRIAVEGERFALDLDHPQGLAISPAGETLYVADSKHLLLLDGNGKVRRRLEQGASPFQEISDIAVSAIGHVYVLDAGRPAISIFDAAGTFLREVPTQEIHTERARGIYLDHQDHIWIASTANSQIVLLDSEGTLRQTIALDPEATAQPVDVLVTLGGHIYFTDVTVHQLVRRHTQSAVLDTWDIPVANSFAGPHLASDENGILYITAPELGLVLRLNPKDGTRQEWLVPGQSDVPPKIVGIAVDKRNRVWVLDREESTLIALSQPE